MGERLEEKRRHYFVIDRSLFGRLVRATEAEKSAKRIYMLGAIGSGALLSVGPGSLIARELGGRPI
jgi:hypothetical protein